jgi:hypothetical protein
MKLYNLFSSLFREEGWRLAGVVHVPVWARADARIACGVIAFACVSWGQPVHADFECSKHLIQTDLQHRHLPRGAESERLTSSQAQRRRLTDDSGVHKTLCCLSIVGAALPLLLCAGDRSVEAQRGTNTGRRSSFRESQVPQQDGRAERERVHVLCTGRKEL